MSCTAKKGATDVIIDVVVGRASAVLARICPDGDGNVLRRRLAVEVCMDLIDRKLADLVGMLLRIADHLTRVDGFASLRRRVVTHDLDLAQLACGFDGLERT